MKKLLKQSIPLLVSIVVISFSVFTFNCMTSNCSLEQVLRPLFSTWIKPLGIFFTYSTVGLVALPFVSVKTYQSGIKFIIGWSIATVILVAFTQTNSNAYLPILDPEKASVALVMGTLLSLITIIIVVKKSFFTKKQLQTSAHVVVSRADQ